MAGVSEQEFSVYSEDRAWADIGNARCPQSTGLPPPRPPAQVPLQVTTEQTRRMLRAAPGPARVPLALHSPRSGQAAVGGAAQARVVEQQRQPRGACPCAPGGVALLRWTVGDGEGRGTNHPSGCPFALYGVLAAPTGETGAKVAIVGGRVHGAVGLA